MIRMQAPTSVRVSDCCGSRNSPPHLRRRAVPIAVNQATRCPNLLIRSVSHCATSKSVSFSYSLAPVASQQTSRSRSCIAAVRGRKKKDQPEGSQESSEPEPSIPPPYTSGEESISEGQISGNVEDGEAWDAALVDGTAADQDAEDEDYYEEYEESEFDDDDGLGEEGEENVAQRPKGVPRITSAWLDYDDIKAEQDNKKKANPNVMSINEYLRSQQVSPLGLCYHS